jgi:large subunit ribosomal protein L25
MATATLSASPRAGSGKGAARTLRREGQVPGVVYGHAREPQSLALNARDLERLLARVNAESTVIELSVDGRTARTLIREIQRHPYKRDILHVDFQELVAGEKVTVHVPLVLHGTAEGVRAGGIMDQVMRELEIEVDPSNIPERFDVDVSALTIGHSLHVRDVPRPEGVTVLDDEDATICVVIPPRAETPTAGVETVAEPAAEPELIGRKPKEEGEGEGEGES